MKPIELVEIIKKSNPDLLKGIPDDRAARIIRSALTLLGEELEAANEGAVKAPGLGNFQIRQVQREKDGRTETVKRIILKVIKPKNK
jgi:hypothetical protein